jgi:hypothetical protein
MRNNMVLAKQQELPIGQQTQLKDKFLERVLGQ